MPKPDGFTGGFRTGNRQSEPKLGLFFLVIHTPWFQTSPRWDKWAETSHTPAIISTTCWDVARSTTRASITKRTRWFSRTARSSSYNYFLRSFDRIHHITINISHHQASHPTVSIHSSQGTILFSKKLQRLIIPVPIKKTCHEDYPAVLWFEEIHWLKDGW